MTDEIEVDITAPVPPSKKELRRLRKGKPLPASKSGAEPIAGSEGKHIKAEVEKRSEHAVQEKKYGKVVHNKGHAFVDFATAQGVTHALELSEQLLSGRRLLIKDHKSRRADKMARHQAQYAWIVFEELPGAESAVKGYVMVKEEDPDFSESDESEVESGAEGASKLKPKKFKLRKWWVNKINGRPLRMEFAEDAQVRYKKRYGKGGTKSVPSNGAHASEPVGESLKSGPVIAKTVEYRNEYAPRLTGGIVQSKGSKVTF
ncbi:putative rna binding protein [Diplocarpon rosae]|nr:putative rna binding protein [Diplocarpon rosae]